MTGSAILRAMSCLAAAAVALAACPVSAQPAAEFFKGKTVKLAVGTSAGGGYDLYARMFAPHFAKQLGATVIVENRPGGSHMVALNSVHVAPPDGLSMILASAEGAVLGRLLGEPSIRFDLSEFPAIARVNTAPRVLIVNPKMPFRTVDELKASGRLLTMSFAGTTDGGSDTGMIMCHALGIGCKSIIGYPSSKEFTMAAIKGESDGTVLADDSASRFSDGGQLVPITVIGRERSTLLPGVPTLHEATKLTPEAAYWVDLRDEIRNLGRLLVTTPGTPADRVEHLRAAARTVLTSPEVTKEFAARGMPVQFAPATEMTATIKRLLGGGVPADKLKELRHIIIEKYYK